MALLILNEFSKQIPTLIPLVTFLKANVSIVVAFTIFFMIAEILFETFIPFNLLAPIFNAFGSIYLIKFLFSMINKITSMNGADISVLYFLLRIIVYPIVFVIVLITGYVKIFNNKPMKKKVRPDMKKDKKIKHDEKSWEDIGNSFRRAISDLFRKLAEIIDKK